MTVGFFDPLAQAAADGILQPGRASRMGRGFFYVPAGD